MVGEGTCRSTFEVFTNDQIMNFHAFAADLKMRKLRGFQIFKADCACSNWMQLKG